MVFKRYIHKHGKKLGPYYYENVRSHDGKVKSIYVGTNPHHHTKHKIRKPLFIIILILAIILIFGSLLFFLQSKVYLASRENQQPPDFEVDQILLKVLVRSSEFLEKQIRIMNIGGEQIHISLDAQGLSDLLKIDSNSFSLKPGQTKIATLTFSSIIPEQNIEHQPGIYVGKFLVKSAKSTREIPIIIEIETKNVLFDMNLNPVAIERKVKQGSDITIEVRLFNLQSIESQNVDVEYFVKDINGNTILTEQETVVAKTQASFFKTISIPRNLKPGPYVFAASAKFGNSVGTASYLFDVISPETEASLLHFCRNNILCIGISFTTLLLLIALVFYFYFFVGAYLYEKIIEIRARNKRREKTAEKIQILKPEEIERQAGIFQNIKDKLNKWKKERQRKKVEKERIERERELKKLAEQKKIQLEYSRKQAEIEKRALEELKKQEEERKRQELEEKRRQEEKLRKEEEARRQSELEAKTKREELRRIKLDKVKLWRDRKKKGVEFFHKIGLYKTSEEREQIAQQKQRERQERERKRQEEIKRIEEEKRQRELQKERERAEELKRKEELQKQRGIEEKRRQEEKQRKAGELRKQRELEEKKKAEELKRQKELEEKQNQEELIKLKEAEEERKRVKELRRREELKRQEELRRQQELEKKRQEEEKRKQELELLEREKELRKQKEIEEKTRLQRLELLKRTESELNKKKEELQQLNMQLEKSAAELKLISDNQSKATSRIKEIDNEILNKSKQFEELHNRKKLLQDGHKQSIDELNASHELEKKNLELKIKEQKVELSKKEFSLLKGLAQELKNVSSEKRKRLEKWKKLEIKAKIKIEEQQIEDSLKKFGSILIDKKKKINQEYNKSLRELNKKQEEPKQAISGLKNQKQQILLENENAPNELSNKESEIQRIKQKMESNEKEQKFLRAELKRLKEESRLKWNFLTAFVSGYKHRVDILKQKQEQEPKLDAEKKKLKEIEIRKKELEEETRKEEQLRRQKEAEAKKKEVQPEIKIEKELIGKTKKFEKCHKALQNVKEALGKNDLGKAKKLYIEARNIYVDLEYNEKKELYNELMELYNKLMNAK